MNLSSSVRKHLREYGRAVVRREACARETHDWYLHNSTAGYHEERAEQLMESYAVCYGDDLPPLEEHERLRAEAVERARKEAARAAKKAGKA